MSNNWKEELKRLKDTSFSYNFWKENPKEAIKFWDNVESYIEKELQAERDKKLWKGKGITFVEDIIKEELKKERDRIMNQLKSHKHYKTEHDTDDPIANEIVRIQNIGYEEAHKLHPCGHSQGDYRDPNYGTNKYDGDERCVGCDSIKSQRDRIAERLEGIVKQYKCGKHKRLLKAIREETTEQPPLCKCICHGGKYRNDCYYINKGICEGCGNPCILTKPSPKQ